MSSNPQIRRSEAILCPIASNDDIRTAAVESLAQIIPVSPFITGIVLTKSKSSGLPQKSFCTLNVSPCSCIVSLPAGKRIRTE